MLNPYIEIVLVFGKNEDNLPFSFGLTDFIFLRSFRTLKLDMKKGFMQNTMLMKNLRF